MMLVRNTAFALGVTVATAICGCGSSSSSSSSSASSSGAAQGGTSVNGTFGGQTLTVQDAIAEIETEAMVPVTVTSANIFIASVGSLCSLAQRHVSSPDASLLDLNFGGPGTQITPGTYEVNGNGSSAMFGAAYFSSQDARCAGTFSAIGKSGTITITDVSPSSVSGSFDVVFNATSSTGATSATADHVTGHFSAPVCSVPATDGGAPHSCGGA
jgi:hypothetical protein